MMKKLSALFCIFLAGCSTHVSHYSDQTPTMNFYDYFNGPVDGWGTITDFKGRVTHRFHVFMDGSLREGNEGEYLRIDETFTYADGAVQERYWDVFKTDDASKLRAQAPEVPGGATGEQQGSAIQWIYKFDLPYNGKTIRVNMDDWMWMVDDETLINKNIIRKFGIKVGELNILFRKREGNE